MTTSETTAIFSQLMCEQQEENLFVGHCSDFGGGHLYGGQAMAQAIVAAQETVKPGRWVHSLFASFLRPGNVNLPVHYEVERSRDGTSYSSRRIIASQEGREIIHLTLSLRDDNNAEAIYPECELPLYALEMAENDYERFVRQWHADLFDLRVLPGRDAVRSNSTQTWLKPKGKLPDQQTAHAAFLAYLSDITILPSHIPLLVDLDRDSALKPMTSYVMSSLNHSMWFHRPVKVDDWLLYDSVPEYTAENHGLARGLFYTRDGSLVASTTQEGIFKRRRQRD